MTNQPGKQAHAYAGGQWRCKICGTLQPEHLVICGDCAGSERPDMKNGERIVELSGEPVVITDIKVPFGSVFALVFKVGLAAVPVAILIAMIWSFVSAFLGLGMARLWR